jgi:hypothetical protein
MTDEPQLFTDGGIDARRYAAVCLALGWVRGTLSNVLRGVADSEEVKQALRCSSTMAIAQALGLEESALSIDWGDYLTSEEQERLRVGTPEPLPPTG